MEYSLEKLPDQRAIVRVSGRLDASVAQAFRDVLKSAVAEGTVSLVIDMHTVSFIDSSGLSSLVSGFKAAREKEGTLVLAGPGVQVRMALELTQLDRIFLAFDSVAMALGHLDSLKNPAP
jgi:anti-anti-sigma factor